MTDRTGFHRGLAFTAAIPEKPIDQLSIVLVHGSMDNSSSLSGLRDGLGGRRTLIYDRRGYGRSLVNEQPVDIAGHVADLIEMLPPRPALVFGHSLGAVITLAAAQQAPERFLGVVAYEPPMPWEKWWPTFELRSDTHDSAAVRLAAESFLKNHLGSARWNALTDQRRESLLGMAPAWAAEVLSARDAFPAPFQPKSLRLPVLALWGENTDARHARAARELASRAPKGYLAQIVGADHQGHRTAHEPIAQWVHRFVSKIKGHVA